MIRRKLVTALSAMASAATIVAAPVAQAEDDAVDIDALVERMTLEEKVGQLNQYPGGRSKNLNSRIDDAELDRVREGKVGSYLHVAGAEFLGKLQRVAVEESRLKIPLLFAMDVVHGYRTIFPVPIAMAATWDEGAVEHGAHVAAEEAASAGLHWTFAPMIDIARDPRWGRIVEGAGSDPYLGSRMAVAQVRGFQGDDLGAADTIVATPKHFGAYGAGEGGRDYDSADISARTLNEVYLPPFYAAAKAGAASYMTAFNDIAGVPTTSNRALIRDTLKTAWGFEGLVVSDWNSIAELLNHGVASTRAEAGRLALSAGVDMDMSSLVYSEELAGAVKGNRTAMAELDDAVKRVLRVKAALGLFDDPYKYHDAEREAALILSPEHRAHARDAAQKAIVLMKNEGGVLPLSRDLKRIAVVGALAEDARSPQGSWRAQGRDEDTVSILAGIRAAAPDAEILYEPGASDRSDDESGIKAAVKVAKRADATVLVIGEDFDWSGEARSRSDVTMPGAQVALAKAILETGKPVAVVLTNGRPLALPYVAEAAPAILETWILGTEAGTAVADVLFGDVNPGGKLPVDFPRVTGQVPFHYAHRNSGRPADPDPSKDTARYSDLPITAQFPFGHGLSYTTFDYADLALSAETIGADGAVEISVSVTNAGDVAGDEVVQLYVRDPVAQIARPVQELRGFKRVALEPGATKRVTFTLSAAQLAYYDADGKWRIDAGAIEVMVGSSSADIRAREEFQISSSGWGTAPAAALPTPVNVEAL